MTVKVVLKRFNVYVYNVRDESEGIALAKILETRLERDGKLKNTRIDAWKMMDSTNTYHCKQRFNNDWEIK